ncbi:MAG: TetR/AcrR family transcriptional regulator [Bradymonadia bacterium]
MNDKSSDNPRTERMRATVLRAGCELLATAGGDAVTALRISEQTGVARSAIYRHWPDQSALLLDVIDRVVTPRAKTRTTGHLEADLTSALSNLRARMRKRPFRKVFGTLLDHANRDDRFVEPQRRFVQGVLTGLADVLRHATENGELPATLAIDSACARLAGPMLTQHVLLRIEISDELIRDTVAQFIERESKV